ncbi:glycosyltransferase family 2 protein [Actibacterium pelagium]|uniref:Glycosyl transferase n=1 Tax=Actibacterium pelagium TaxID=2029103 RepID=A0A917ABN5_9RHOB|nr:glycosyltransferase family 2 protein [Actibacterium pelagium]GGE39562.1 glycosyl transferase [Actibacterium pelagium]
MLGASNVRVSVLIPVFNGEASIVKALSCVTEQSLESLEVIVVDDASTDGTSHLVEREALKDQRIKLIRLEENVGPGSARAAGLRVASGKWISILDADDWIAPTRLETLVNEAEANGLDAIADNLALVDPGLGTVVGTAFPLVAEDKVDITIDSFLRNSLPGAKVNLGWMQPVVRSEFLAQHKISWPSLRHAEDMVFQARMLIAGARFSLKGEALYHYTQRRGTRSGKASNLSKTKRSIRDQQEAVAIILQEVEASKLSRFSQYRLAKLPHEIEATSHALNCRDALQSRQLLAAAVEAFRAIGRPTALLRCLAVRYLVGEKLR